MNQTEAFFLLGKDKKKEIEQINDEYKFGSNHSILVAKTKFYYPNLINLIIYNNINKVERVWGSCDYQGLGKKIRLLKSTESWIRKIKVKIFHKYDNNRSTLLNRYIRPLT